MQSVDGRVACDMVDKISGDEYYDTLESFECPSHIEGKYSYQLHYCGFDEFKPIEYVPVNKEAFYKAKQCNGYEISVDTNGVLLWKNTGNENRLCIVSEKASTEYLDYLKELGISYIAVGKKKIDLTRAMEILYDEFGVKRVAVVGGGKINGSFLAENLIDELSVMIGPGIDGRCGQPALFDGLKDSNGYLPLKLRFQSVSTYPNGVIWLKYNIK